MNVEGNFKTNQSKVQRIIHVLLTSRWLRLGCLSYVVQIHLVKQKDRHWRMRCRRVSLKNTVHLLKRVRGEATVQLILRK